MDACQREKPGPWFNIKMSSCQYRKSHCGDYTAVRSPYLNNGISYTSKMSSLYWTGALGDVGRETTCYDNLVQPNYGSKWSLFPVVFTVSQAHTSRLSIVHSNDAEGDKWTIHPNKDVFMISSSLSAGKSCFIANTILSLSFMAVQEKTWRSWC